VPVSKDHEILPKFEPLPSLFMSTSSPRFSNRSANNNDDQSQGRVMSLDNRFSRLRREVSRAKRKSLEISDHVEEKALVSEVKGK